MAFLGINNIGDLFNEKNLPYTLAIGAALAGKPKIGLGIAGLGLLGNSGLFGQDGEAETTPTVMARNGASLGDGGGSGATLIPKRDTTPAYAKQGRTAADTPPAPGEQEMRSPDDVRWTRRKPRGFMADLYGDYPMSPVSNDPPAVRDEIASGLFGGPAEMDEAPSPPSRSSVPSRPGMSRPADVRALGVGNDSGFMRDRAGGGGRQGAGNRSGFMRGRKNPNPNDDIDLAQPENVDTAPPLTGLGDGPSARGPGAMTGGRNSIPPGASPARPNMPLVDGKPATLFDALAPNASTTAPGAPSEPSGGEGGGFLSAMTQGPDAGSAPGRVPMVDAPTGGAGLDTGPTDPGSVLPLPQPGAPPDPQQLGNMLLAAQTPPTVTPESAVPSGAGPSGMSAPQPDAMPSVMGAGPAVNFASPTIGNMLVQASLPPEATSDVSRVTDPRMNRLGMTPRADRQPIQTDFEYTSPEAVALDVANKRRDLEALKEREEAGFGREVEQAAAELADKLKISPAKGLPPGVSRLIDMHLNAPDSPVSPFMITSDFVALRDQGLDDNEAEAALRRKYGAGI